MNEETSSMTVARKINAAVSTDITLCSSFDWQITLFNEINNETKTDNDVSVMIFQASAPLQLASTRYSSAWYVADIPSPGQVGPIKLPRKVQFGVLDKVEDDVPRLAGPVDVEFGQSVNVVQQNKEVGAKINISGDPQPDKKITATNCKGNAQPLEMALFKSGKKLVSYKNIVPNTGIFFLLNPEVFYIMDATNVTKGEDFEASQVIETATKFSLSSEKQKINIKITRKSTEELEFKEFEPSLVA